MVALNLVALNLVTWHPAGAHYGWVGSLTATAAFALLIYNNWSYVRTRLLSATVEYEETGWYDGQVYVKAGRALEALGCRV
jgi:hypothetical protein